MRSKWSDQCFQIAVLALLKSGKSTLINAWLGNEFLASCNTAESARIVRVQHAPASTPVLKEITGCEEVILARGPEAIRNKIKAFNKAVRDSGELPPEDELVLEAPLICLADRELGEHRFLILVLLWPLLDWTPALTVPQLQNLIAGVLERRLGTCNSGYMRRTASRRLCRIEEARFYRWLALNRLPPLRVEQREHGPQ